MDSRYATSTVVSSQLVNSFIEPKLTARNYATKIVELHNKLMTLYYDIKAVNQEGQATQNTFLLQRTVQKIPKEYQKDYATVSMEKRSLPGETQWNSYSTNQLRILAEFYLSLLIRLFMFQN